MKCPLCHKEVDAKMEEIADHVMKKHEDIYKGLLSSFMEVRWVEEPDAARI